MKIRRVLIVDDEPGARNDLRQLLVGFSEIEIVAEAGCVPEAIDHYRQFKPDLIFLDVQMPKRDGFALLPHLRPVPEIIFTTGYDCFAVKAFEVNAVDYLVKPISSERLDLALNRLKKPPNRTAKPFERDDHVFLFPDQEVRVVMAKHITHIEGAGNYSRVHVADQEPSMILQRMKEWERILPQPMFKKITRSLLVNLYAVQEVTNQRFHHTVLRLTGAKEEIRLSRLAARTLRKAIAAIAHS